MTEMRKIIELGEAIRKGLVEMEKLIIQALNQLADQMGERDALMQELKAGNEGQDREAQACHLK